MKITIYFVLAIIVAIAFNVWLDHGCRLNGVITSHGIACIN